MSKILILLFHPDLARSRANAALVAGAKKLKDVEVVDMQALYPSGATDVEREVLRLLETERIVLQFPVQWYSAPPLLKAWQNAVLTRMFYMAYQEEGSKLEGKPLLIAATAGNSPAAYAPTGANLFPLEELLLPLRATANRCALAWKQPFLLYDANRLDDALLREEGERYADTLRQWAEE